MKNKFLIILFLFACNTTFIYSQKGYAIFTPQSQNKAYLYKNAVSKHPIDSIVNDSIAEIYYCVSIEKTTCKRAFVSTFVGGGLTEHNGWIEWENLGIRLIYDTIYIREKPNKHSKILNVIYEADWIDLYPISNAKNEWLYIEDKNRNIMGWIAPEHQCSNSYTTCN